MGYPVTPADLSSLAYWLEARQLTAKAANGVLASATDYVGKTATPYSGTHGPTLMDDDLGPGLYFDGGASLVETTLAIAPATAAIFAVVDIRSINGSSGLGFGAYGAIAGLRDSAGDCAGLGILHSYGNSYTNYWSGSPASGGIQTPSDTTNIYCGMDQHLCGSENYSSVQYIHVNGNRSSTGTANTYTTTSAGVNIGTLLPTNNATYNFVGIIRAIVILNNPSAADINFTKGYLISQFPPRPFSRELPLCIVGGNSIAAGMKSTIRNTTYWAKGISSVKVAADWRIRARSGYTTTQLTSLLDKDVYPLLDPRRPIIVYSFYEVVNDMLNNGASAATAWTNTVTHFNDVQSQAPNVVCVVPTIMNFSSGYGSIVAAYNALVYANRATAIPGSALWDVAANATIGATGANTNTTYFDSDGTHLTDAGASVLAGTWAVCIKSLLSISGSAGANGRGISI